ncbi:MAG: META domain-containing protein [Anaerolineae bacterium]
MSKVLIALAIIIGLALLGCTSPNTLNIRLNGSSWFLETLGEQPVMPDTLVTLKFQNGQLNGVDGCNNYSTTYSVDREMITINKNIASTMMACAEPIMQQSSAYYAALAQVNTYKIEGKRLSLLDANSKVLATFFLENTDLGGTAWIVTGYNNGQEAVVSIVNGSEITALFSADGKLSGSAGCNRYTATYETIGSSIKIGTIGVTKKNCNDPSGVMIQEMQFIAALESVASYRFNGGILEMHTAAGALAVTLKKAG